MLQAENIIRVLIADDHAILRDGIRSLLDRQPDIRVVGEAANGQEAINQTGLLKPDIVLMDITMPVMNGLAATQEIKARYPEIKVLILTQHDQREYIEPLLKAGAVGYVLKRSGGREVLQAIRKVFEEGAFLEPAIARQVLTGFHKSSPEGQEIPQMTDREIEVLHLVAAGKNNNEIALILNISPKTVSVHRSNIMLKLGVRNGVELIRYIMERGVLKRIDPESVHLPSSVIKPEIYK